MNWSFFLLITAIYIQPILLCGQQDIRLPGLIVEQNSKYKTGQVNYLSGVSIKSPGAMPSVSDRDGRFTLLYADQPFGGQVRIYAAKSGFEVVNKKEMESAGIVGRKEPMKIVMSDPEELYRNQAAYYGIAEDVIRTTYERQLRILKGEGKEKDELVAQLKREMKREIRSREEAEVVLAQQLRGLEERIQGLADKFVTVNLDDQSETYIRAYEAFKVGNLDRTIAILDSVDLAGRLAMNEAAKTKEEQTVNELQEKIAVRRQQMRQDIEQVVLKARSQRLKFQFDESEASYELALQYDTLNMDLRWEFADMLAGLNQFDKAVHYYEQLLQLTQNDQQRVEALTKVGVVQKGGMRTDEAEKRLKEALEIQRKLAKKNPDTALPALAGILNNLGVLYIKKGISFYSRAELFLVEALNIRRELVKKDASIYLSELAQTLNNLGIIYASQRSFASAEQQYTEALNIYQRLDETEPGTYLPYIAAALTNLGNLLNYPWDISKMKIRYGEALNIYQNLAKKNPKAYNLDLSSTAYNISFFYRQKLEYGYDDSLKKEGMAHLQEAELALTIYPDSVPVVRNQLEKLEILKQSFQSVTPESVERNITQKKIKQLEGNLAIESTTNFNDIDKDPIGMNSPPRENNMALQALPRPINRSPSDERSTENKAELANQSIPRTKELINLYINSSAYSLNDQEVKAKLADAHNRLAHDYLYTKNFSAAEQAARIGLSYNPAAIRINTNLALSLLFQGKWGEAETLLTQFKAFEPANQQLFLEELDALDKEGIKHKSAKNARKLLKDN